MTLHPPRRHIRHFERVGGIAHATWRLHYDQSLLGDAERSVVLEILERSRDFGCSIRAAVVMDDHVHVLFTAGASRSGAQFIASWKSASAHRIVALGSRTAPLWQAEYYLRWMNSERETDLCAAYIRDNPRRRWPGVERYPWLLP